MYSWSNRCCPTCLRFSGGTGGLGGRLGAQSHQTRLLKRVARKTIDSYAPRSGQQAAVFTTTTKTKALFRSKCQTDTTLKRTSLIVQPAEASLTFTQGSAGALT
ncbi:hypothetical protein EYF80_007149 [Liparis tanakae]|uniref:Uncharacterized protein n=1 Tax=Liparis tanakae TaxID=230148 RepID=A0A4Z2IXZ3_9TELE|nr:hypothetical protein EYF80_007149 [Liparis tanakae]